MTPGPKDRVSGPAPATWAGGPEALTDCRFTMGSLSHHEHTQVFRSGRFEPGVEHAFGAFATPIRNRQSNLRDLAGLAIGSIDAMEGWQLGLATANNIPWRLAFQELSVPSFVDAGPQ